MSQARKVRQLAHKVTITIVSPYKSEISDIVSSVSRFKDAYLIGEVHSVIGVEEFQALTGVTVLGPEDVGM